MPLTYQKPTADKKHKRHKNNTQLIINDPTGYLVSQVVFLENHTKSKCKLPIRISTKPIAYIGITPSDRSF